MKKFHFSLETVLDYKQQILASLQAEHGAILEAEYQQMDGEFAQRKLEGIAILDAMKYEQYLRAMERQIQLALEDLAQLQKKEEAKRAEVVTAKQDTSSIEKLREKKLDHYKKAMQKNEEAMIDELVSTKRVMEAQSA